MPANTVKDWAGNSAVTKTSWSITVDTTLPTASANNSWSWKTSDITITLRAWDTWWAWLKYAKYRWWNSDCTNWTSYSDWSTISFTTEWTATLYLCVWDNAWNTNTWNWTYYLDKTAPTLKSKTTYGTSWYTSNQWSTFTYEDTVSWINWATTTSCTISSEWSASTCTTSNTKICNNAWLCNTTNQTSNSIKLDKTAPTLKSKTTYGTSWYTM